jgi:Protein of unknown function (DUF1579)
MNTESSGDAPRMVAPSQHQRLPEHEAMSSLIGKWINTGETIPANGTPPEEISASDIYEWVAGRFFVVHTAYDRIANAEVGGVELIGYDAETRKYRTYFFDSQGNISNDDLTYRDGTWTWSGEHARATGTLSDDGMAMATLHEWSDDGANWRPSMHVTLRKVT